MRDVFHVFTVGGRCLGDNIVDIHALFGCVSVAISGFDCVMGREPSFDGCGMNGLTYG